MEEGLVKVNVSAEAAWTVAKRKAAINSMPLNPRVYFFIVVAFLVSFIVSVQPVRFRSSMMKPYLASIFIVPSAMKFYCPDMQDGTGSAAALLPPVAASLGGTPAATPACDSRSSSVKTTSSHSNKRSLTIVLIAFTTAP
jgi:hypothetical protein